MASRKRKSTATLLGYARVSKSDGKSTRVQVQALKAAGGFRSLTEAIDTITAARVAACPECL